MHVAPQPLEINAGLERAAELAHHTLQKKYDGLDERNRLLIAEFSAKRRRAPSQTPFLQPERPSVLADHATNPAG